MKIGKFVKNSEGVVEEVVESTVYPNWREAQEAAEVLMADCEDDESVCGIFLAVETSPDTYIIKSILWHTTNDDII